MSQQRRVPSPGPQHPSLWRRGSKIFSTLAGVLVVPCVLGGCVERLLQVRSAPEGAEVTLNGEPVVITVAGTQRPALTPVDIPFDHYGTYGITARLRGHDSQFRRVTLSAPVYQYPILDFVAENLLPWTIRYHREVVFELERTPKFDDAGDRALSELFDRVSAIEARLETPADEASPPREEHQ